MKEYADMRVRNYSYVFSFEREFVHKEALEWMVKNWTSSFYYVALYVLIIFGGKYLMRDKPPFDLKIPLILWNLGLATFSAMGTIRTIPEFVHTISNYGIYYSVCIPSYLELDRVSSFWTWLFILSKLPEFGDTVFIILRKKPLMFLHWYHHITVLLYAWFTFSETASIARWFTVMNYPIHTLMYSYYALRAMGYNPPHQIAMFITTLQLLQMVVGCSVNIWALHLLNNNVTCKTSYNNIRYSLMMYFSFFLLFSNYFYKSYICKKKKTRTDQYINASNSAPSKTKVQ